MWGGSVFDLVIIFQTRRLPSLALHKKSSPAEPNDLVIQPRLGREGHQELGAICVRAVVGHGQNSGLVELDGERFVSEGLSIDGASSVPITGRDVSSLHPRVSHHAVEGAPLVVQPAKTRGTISRRGQERPVAVSCPARTVFTF